MKEADDSYFDVVIEPKNNVSGYWKEIWNYKSLFYFLAWRDILVRYKQTAIGIAWSLLKPLITLVVFTVIFGLLAKFPSEGVPYPILVFSALLPWQFFSGSFSDASNSILANSNIISKVYFPRLIIPISSTVGNMVDFLISFGILLVMMVIYGLVPGWRIFMIPFFLLIALIASLGLSLIVASINVKYRDFKHLIPIMTQAGLYISPVGFSSDIVPIKWQFLYSLNPMVGVIDGFRWAIIGQSSTIYFPGLIISVLFSITLFFLGILYFRKTERKFADFI